MPWVRASIVSALIAFLSLALPAQAAPAPIVFDFEDGLQGWELHGAATRVQTQVLGGEWAIFMDNLVDGIVWISMEVQELQAVGPVSFDQLIIEGDIREPDPRPHGWQTMDHDSRRSSLRGPVRRDL